MTYSYDDLPITLARHDVSFDIGPDHPFYEPLLALLNGKGGPHSGHLVCTATFLDVESYWRLITVKEPRHNGVLPTTWRPVGHAKRPHPGQAGAGEEGEHQ